MERTSTQLSELIAHCGWTLVRTPVGPESNWKRWRVAIAGEEGSFGFHRVGEVERFWESAFRAHLTCQWHAASIADWYARDAAGLRDAIDGWLEQPAALMPPTVKAKLRDGRHIAMPVQWRKEAMAVRPLKPPAGHDLRAVVRERLLMG